MSNPQRPARAALPIDDVLDELLQVVRTHPSVLLRAPTGAGKTTRVPLALLEAGLAGDGEILVLQPRRLPARAAARRTASELGCKVGEEVGYQVRFDSKRGPRTRITFLTEGLFLRRLQDNPFLEGVSVVIFDEFHERHLDGDLALAMTRRVQLDVREDLRLILMSATLEIAGLDAYLDDAPLVESLGRSYPVDISYLSPKERPARGELQSADIARVVQRALKETSGDVLVFLPGVGEIRRLHPQLADACRRMDIRLIDLYGDLAPEEQDRALELREGRSVFLSTNVAETSITLPKVTAVVDSGMMRMLEFDPGHGLNRLLLTAISHANADQRAGRAGRTQAGSCYRLWTEQDQRSRPAQGTPEVRRVDCTGALLQLAAWGEARPLEFPWLEAPLASSLQTACASLEQLGALRFTEDGSCRLTKVGEQLSRMPIHPRLARLLLEGAKLGVASEAALGAALLSERSPFRRGGRREASWNAALDSDLIDQVHGMQAFEQSGQRVSPAGELSPGAAKGLLRIRQQLLRSLPRRSEQPLRMDADEALARALLAAYTDRLARRREPGSDRAVMMGGRGVRLARESNVQAAELFLCLDVDARSGEGLVRCASEVRREWLPREALERGEQLRFDEGTARVVAVQAVVFHGLELDSRPGKLVRNDASAQVLARAATENLSVALDLQQPDYISLVARVSALAKLSPQLELPRVDDGYLVEHLETLCRGKLSFAELRQAPLASLVRQTLDWKQQQALDRDFPERIEVPSGNHIAIRYELGKPPVLAARIQELFGWKETPRIAGGRVPLLLHLLAPNMRPQQVTEDLASFWNTTYAQVRKELRRRYPKHDWPEDPWTAIARKRRR